MHNIVLDRRSSNEDTEAKEEDCARHSGRPSRCETSLLAEAGMYSGVQCYTARMFTA
jgi:hypothetical protein